MHIHRKTKTFLLRVTDSGNDTDDVTDTNFTQGNDITNYRPTVPVVQRFTGCPSGLLQIEPPYIYKYPSPPSILLQDKEDKLHPQAN